MTKVILGKTPKTFKPTSVKFPMPDGTEGAILATFNYRTRTEFGAFLDQIFTDAGEEAQKPDKINWEELFGKTKDKNADHLLLALADWDLDGHELNLASLKQLADELPAASAALMAAYNAACTEGRLGN